MFVLYNIFLGLFKIGIQISSFWNDKSRLWLSGRKNILHEISKSLNNNESPIVWVHCASLGEFEQGRELIEKIKETQPDVKIFLTFFSPSGYEIRKNYEHADWVYYLPLDGKKTSKLFIEIVNPVFAVFVKYDSWHYYLHYLKLKKVPTFLISALFTPNLAFFGFYGKFFRKMLDNYSHIFVQDKHSLELLQKFNIKAPISIGGDTRFDRVSEIANTQFKDEIIEEFICENTIIAGSTWKEDEAMLRDLSCHFPEFKLIIAPHETNEKHIEAIEKLFDKSARYSSFNSKIDFDKKVLIIDSIGKLSRLYRYAKVCYIGGGFNKTGIHNILEASAYGKVVFFGPIYNFSKEAFQLIERGCAYTYENKDDFIFKFKSIVSEEKLLEFKSLEAQKFVLENTGATKILMNHFVENRLFTNASN